MFVVGCNVAKLPHLYIVCVFSLFLILYDFLHKHTRRKQKHKAINKTTSHTYIIYTSCNIMLCFHMFNRLMISIREPYTCFRQAVKMLIDQNPINKTIHHHMIKRSQVGCIRKHPIRAKVCINNWNSNNPFCVSDGLSAVRIFFRRKFTPIDIIIQMFWKF